MLARLTLALACASSPIDGPDQPAQRSDEFEPVSIEVIERIEAPEPEAPEPEAPELTPGPTILPRPSVEPEPTPAPTRCIAEPRCVAMRSSGIALGLVGLAAVGTGVGLITRSDRVIADMPAFVTSTRPAGLVVLTLGVGVTLTAALVLVASRSATRTSAPKRRATLEGLTLRF